MSSLSRAETADASFCNHRVPANVCTQHHPELIAQFKASGDWCGEHGVPESQCYKCHPNLTFEPIPEPPAGADIANISPEGQDVHSLQEHAAPNKVTVFDFYADWCISCRDIEAHLVKQLSSRTDLAVRKINVSSWDSPVARRYLANVKSLPYVIVIGKDLKQVAAISGVDLAALDRAIGDGAK